ncbi:MAG: LysM peptidoglycan-binding domain-containing protein [Nitriliruptoraceae bacterium]
MAAMTLPTRPDAAQVDVQPVAPAASSAPVRVARRRRALLVVLVLIVTVLTLVLGGSDAGAQLDDPVAGHVVVTPGETLWDVAVATAPPGVDARAQVRAIQELNGLDGADLAAWSVLLLPAR